MTSLWIFNFVSDLYLSFSEPTVSLSLFSFLFLRVELTLEIKLSHVHNVVPGRYTEQGSRARLARTPGAH